MKCGLGGGGWRAGLALVAAAAALGACDVERKPAAPTAEERIERIVLVSIDTLRADRVGCYGAAEAETPVLDALAAEGVRFETAVSPAPLTLPSHATLLTGRDPPQHGVRHNGLFRLSDDVVPLAEHLRGSGFATAGFVSAFVLDGRYGLARGFDHYDDKLGMLSSLAAGSAAAERRADQTVNAAIAWLDTAPERFFLWVHLYDPHAPYDPPAPYAARFDGRPYDAEIAFADAQVGRLRDALAKRWPHGTLFWLTSDHGDSQGEHGEPTHAYLVYDATQRIPMLRGRAGRAAGCGRDGSRRPRRRGADDPRARGSPATARGERDESRSGAAERRRERAQRGLGRDARDAARPRLEPAARRAHEGHKYVRAPEPELYDLAADPHELTNRAAELPELVAELDRMVEQVAAVGRPVEPSFRPDAEERARLEALGYLQGAAPIGADASLGRVGGPGPEARDRDDRRDQGRDVAARPAARRGGARRLRSNRGARLCAPAAGRERSPRSARR